MFQELFLSQIHNTISMSAKVLVNSLTNSANPTNHHSQNEVDDIPYAVPDTTHQKHHDVYHQPLPVTPLASNQL